MINERLKFIREYEERLSRRIKTAQNWLYSRLLELIAELKTDDNGAIEFSASNIRRKAQLNIIVKEYNEGYGKQLAAWIYRQTVKLFAINKRQFKKDHSASNKQADRVRNRMMLNLGFDEVAQKILGGSWLDNVANNQGIAGELAQDIGNALSGKMKAKDLRSLIRNKFKGQVGILERHLGTIVNSLFASQDRAVGLDFADELQLNYAIYAGTLKNNTREFCKQRVNKVFSRQFIQGWDGLIWRGKIPNQNTLIQLGGYNCRHVLNWISDELATVLIAQRGLNEYN